MATVKPNPSPELVNALNAMVDLAKKMPTEPPATGEIPAEVPKMSDELAALSDVAALEYSKKNGRETYSYYDNGADICDAHEAGQSWMYHKMQEEIKEKDLVSGQWQLRCSDFQREITRLKEQLDFARKEVERSNETIAALTDQLSKVQGERDALKKEFEYLDGDMEKGTGEINISNRSFFWSRVKELINKQ
jgi:predicted  nucleic acid-binding Zn-ribbon protein